MERAAETDGVSGGEERAGKRRAAKGRAGALLADARTKQGPVKGGGADRLEDAGSAAGDEVRSGSELQGAGSARQTEGAVKAAGAEARSGSELQGAESAGQTEDAVKAGEAEAQSGSEPPGAGWLKGAAVLGGAVMVSKLLGTLQKIPLQNVAGDRVFGLYNAVYPFYQLMLYLATAGVPVAVSILVAERAGADGHGGGPRRVLRTAVVLLTCAGLAGFALMWLTAGSAARWIGDAAAAPAIRAAAAALWFVPAMAAFRGYYQGLQRPLPSAVSQVAEQAVRVVAMLALLAFGWSAGWGDGSLAAGATAGSAFGGAAGLAVLLWLWRREQGAGPGVAGPDRGTGSAKEVRTGAGIASKPALPLEGRSALPLRLIAVALPVAAGSIAVPLSGIVDAFTVPRLLRESGLTPETAMTAFGLYSRGQPLVQLVVVLAGAMAGALVPSLIAGRRSGEAHEAAQQAADAMRAAWLVGAASSAGLTLLAGPINGMLYGDLAASGTMAIVGCTALAGTLNAVTAAVLQGVGRVTLPALLLLLATALKALLNAALVPALGIDGAAWSGVVALTAAALLGAAAVRRAAGRGTAGPPAPRFAAGAAGALACMAAALLLVERGFAALLPAAVPMRAAAALVALTGTAVGAAVFAAALLLGGAVGARELRALPGGGKLAGAMRRLRG